MFTRTKGNVGVRVGPRKRGRDVVVWRSFEDAGGSREFTLWLSRDEAERLADALDEILDAIDSGEVPS